MWNLPDHNFVIIHFLSDHKIYDYKIKWSHIFIPVIKNENTWKSNFLIYYWSVKKTKILVLPMKNAKKNYDSTFKKKNCQFDMKLAMLSLVSKISEYQYLF